MGRIIRGPLYKDTKTKRLVHRLRRGAVAVVSHQDLDAVASEDLIRCRPAAVINTQKFLTGSYPTRGAKLLIKAGVVLLEVDDDTIFELPENTGVEIRGNEINCQGLLVIKARRINSSYIAQVMQDARDNMPRRLRDFVENTITFAQREKSLLLKEPPIPSIETDMEGQPVLVAVRGRSYRTDLQAMRTYINEQSPVIVAVDGAADALLDLGYWPDILLGDMDSVSGEVLHRCAEKGTELVVHGYTDGRAPGQERVVEMGLAHQVFSVGGTSEDAALLLADSLGAELIVAVGTHSDPVEFMEKGRAGMASTMLVRLRVGEKLVDAKGVSELYRTEPQPADMLWVLGAGLIPAVVLLWGSPAFNMLFRLLLVHFRATLGV